MKRILQIFFPVRLEIFCHVPIPKILIRFILISVLSSATVLYKFYSQLSFHPPFIKRKVSLPGPHMDEEVERLRTFRNNFPGMTFPKNRISISLKPSPRKLDCPAFPNSNYLEQPHLPSHTRRADFDRYLWAQAVSPRVGNGGLSRTPYIKNDMEKKSRKKDSS